MPVTREIRLFHGGDLGTLTVIGCHAHGEWYWLMFDDHHNFQAAHAICRWAENDHLTFDWSDAEKVMEMAFQPGLDSRASWWECLAVVSITGIAVVAMAHLLAWIRG